MLFKGRRLVSQNGQALVLVLLTLAVVVTVVLFVLARSITDVAVSSRSEEAVRAFSAAEAGIEQALVIGTGGSGAVGGAQFNSSVSGYAENTPNFNFPIDLNSGESMTTWFVSHNTNGTTVCDATHTCFTGTAMNVCWGKSGTDANSDITPAVEVIIFYENTPGTLSSIRIARKAVDPNSGRLGTNGFTQADNVTCTIEGKSYSFQTTVNFADLGIGAGVYGVSNGLQFARVRMFYNSTVPHPVGITVTGTDLPSQGQDITSTGSVGTSSRRVSVFQGWPEPPSVFNYAVYSGTGLTK